jgi:hypothetical protein
MLDHAVCAATLTGLEMIPCLTSEQRCTNMAGQKSGKSGRIADRAFRRNSLFPIYLSLTSSLTRLTCFEVSPVAGRVDSCWGGPVLEQSNLIS